MKFPSFFFLVVVCTFTHTVRTIYEVLKHKKKLTPNKLTFVIIFINMTLLWVSWIALCIMDSFKILLPGILHDFGLLLCITGLTTFVTALFTIKTLETYDGDLITNGIYSKIRHPMYTGFILWSIGFPIYFGAVYASILSLVFIANILFWRYLEEIELEKRFPGYKEYKVKTLF